MPGYELSSDEDEPPVQPDNPPEIENDHDDEQPQIGPAILLPQPVQQQFDFASFMRRSGANTTTLLSVIREADAHLPPGPIVIYSERAGGAVRLNILHIKHVLHILMHLHTCHRREILKQRASKFSRSLCETFAFATSETVSIASGNRLIQTLGNVSIFWIFCIFIIFDI